MTFPTRQEWIFTLRTFAAAMTALYLALWMDLPRPYWAMATTYITSQAFSGATRSKALYRMGGTLLGATVAVILVPTFVNAPVLLTLAISLWVGLCLFVSLHDRTPKSYLPLLAGYTAAIVGFPTVDTPAVIFDTAVSRSQEIILGILCASLASSIILPRSVSSVVAGRVESWLAEARKRALEAFDDAKGTVQMRIARLQLAADASAIDLLGAPLRYEATGAERSAGVLPILRQHMLMMIPTSAAIVDRIRALHEAGGAGPAVEAALAQVREWITAGASDPERTARVKAAIAEIDVPLGPGSTWRDLLTASLATRLRDLIDLRADIRRLRQDVIDRKPPEDRLAFRYSAHARPVRHYDPTLALQSSVSAILAIWITTGIWIVTAWPSGSTAPMMTAVGCCIFASLDDPAPSILTFANSAVVAATAAGIYLFGILPLLTTFEQLAIAFAPYLIVCGLLMTRPQTALIGLSLAANSISVMALQSRYSADFASFVNSAMALVVGLWLAALITRLIRSVSAPWTVARLLRHNRASLRKAARGVGGNHGLELGALMLDRIGLVAPRIARLPPDEIEQIGDLVGEVRVAINVVELRRAHRKLSGEARQAIDEALARLARTGIEGAEPELLAAIDRAIASLLQSPQGRPGRRALLGLTGLRRGLFRDAPGFEPPAAPTEAELAA
ncbi:FUSC family protein [Enterovirga sp.]|uniref:FUSC family protein n=1 Tax=Enterovirga sp. TaxID=2026350 RepID=UPI002C7FB60F|nr:FUSC family protein [Enterovirga sp.]HMO28648.1 FUSC family protein [Enterovirga sp.]